MRGFLQKAGCYQIKSVVNEMVIRRNLAKQDLMLDAGADTFERHILVMPVYAEQRGAIIPLFSPRVAVRRTFSKR